MSNLTEILVKRLDCAFKLRLRKFFHPILIIFGLLYISWPNRNKLKEFSFANSFNTTYFNSYIETQNHIHAIAKKSKNAINSIPIILMWTGIYDIHSSSMIKSGLCGQRAMINCSKYCLFTHRKRFAEKADAIFFYMYQQNDKPSKRFSHQRYVFYSVEAPWFHMIPQRHLLEINWTMTYRLDSDIVIPYGRIRPRSKRDKISLTQIIKISEEKEKNVVWFVSNCQPDSARQIYVNELKNFIDVDIFGTCGNMQCKRNSQRACETMLLKKYRFYIAFENSVCLDYITEKFYRALNNLLVPIVLNSRNYERPDFKGKYIAANRFQSPEILAQYLLYLANNITEYVNYLEWNVEERAESLMEYDSGDDECYGRSIAEGLCILCKKLHNSTEPNKQYRNISYWWNTASICIPGYAQSLIPKDKAES